MKVSNTDEKYKKNKKLSAEQLKSFPNVKEI
jgi:hypothetical protein